MILIVYLKVKLIHLYSNFDSKNLGLPKSFSSLFLQLLFFNNFSFFIGNCLGCCRTKTTWWSRNVVRNITSNASNTSLIPIIVIINWKWKCSIRCIFKFSSRIMIGTYSLELKYQCQTDLLVSDVDNFLWCWLTVRNFELSWWAKVDLWVALCSFLACISSFLRTSFITSL